MGDFKRPNNLDEFHSNFSQIKPLMNATMAYYESSRCLFCYDAPCIKACPTGIDIPLFIRQINNGNLVGAAKTIYEKNYLGNACGKVCPTEVLCEGACVYNEQDVKPIEIGRLQNHASQHVIDHDVEIFTKSNPKEQKIAIIGAGPAGISCASELCKRGYEVKIFEASDKPGGLALFGTAPYKILNEEVTNEVEYLQKQFGFEIQYGRRIDSREEVEFLEAKYDAIFFGVGLGGTRSISLKGEDLENCEGATEFIENLKSDPLGTVVGRKVVVIGGGNTAMDAASESARMGAEEVTLVYRRDRESMRAYEFELELAKSVGVKTIFEAQPIEIMGNERVTGIQISKTEFKDGKLSLKDEATLALDCDMVVMATGQSKQTELFDLFGIEYDERGRILTQNGTYRCSKPNFYAAGDAVNGGAEVVNACAEAKAAAIEIDQYLNP